MIRSFTMGLTSAGIMFAVILYFGSTNVTLGILLGIVSFVCSRAVSRLFDAQIAKITMLVVPFLRGHKPLRNFTISHF